MARISGLYTTDQPSNGGRRVLSGVGRSQLKACAIVNRLFVVVLPGAPIVIGYVQMEAMARYLLFV